MSEHITFWKCPKCHGTGKTIKYWGVKAETEACRKCDGTGNGLVDGEASEHQREIDRIENANRNPNT